VRGAGWLMALVMASAACGQAVLMQDAEKRKAYYKALSKGELLAAAGKWEEARKSYQEAIAVDPSQVEAHQAYQDAMERLGKADAALQEYRNRARHQPGNAVALYLLARIAPEPAEKLKLLKEAIAVDPKLSWAQYALGHVYENLDQWAESEAAFARAIELRPNWAECHNALGFCYMQQGKDEQAEAAFKKALSLNPRFADALVNMGALALRRKAYDQAIDYSQKALEIDKGNWSAHNNLGKAYYHQGRVREAIKAYQAALECKSVDRPEVVYLNMGFCYYHMRQWAQASAAYEKAISLNTEFAYAYYCLAQVKFRQELYGEAWKAVGRAKELGYGPPAHFIKMLEQAQPAPRKPD